MKSLWSIFALILLFSGNSRGAKLEGSQYNHPDRGPPAELFTAAASLPVSAIQAAAATASAVPKDATYRINMYSSTKSNIHTDWTSFKEGAALSWVADMDVDCDGINDKCDGNPDGQPQTNWGALSAYAVPYIVIPDRYLAANKVLLPGNNIAAVICNGQMYYGILGDSNGDSPQITGEASWLMAKTCFPNERLKGDNAHSADDVTYIVFTGKDAVLPDSALNENYITNFDTLRSMGNKLSEALASNLGTRPTQTTTSTGTKTPDSAASSTLVSHTEVTAILPMIWAILMILL
ncbi:fungal chitosanase [Aspergillus avenaceus]|uniref:Endo-chitosanase n=1 Tax=Aspergillus avenaceus TaxID=36643 RepID=A0A5N6U869_ASPAV|nr:fungal chitosanase [Aspergillus avenaceus]